jgi:hypothetical protein
MAGLFPFAAGTGLQIAFEDGRNRAVGGPTTVLSGQFLRLAMFPSSGFCALALPSGKLV